MSKQQGSVEVICGSMFSGKTEELIRRLRRAQYAKQKIQVFKPILDNRYAGDAVVSHEGFTIECIALDRAHHILYLLSPDTDVVGIDEIQFFEEDIIEVVQELADRGKRVLCAGLDQDFTAKGFGPMPQLLAIAEKVDKIQAICMQCGDDASRTHKIAGSSSQVEVGEKELYEARCRSCHKGAAKSEKQKQFSFIE
ncbi:thymidine kinase [Candidatus Nomurabacteria bacterium]|nr:thymidine kinase [Candidatus Nomurabacteria bacterium]